MTHHLPKRIKIIGVCYSSKETELKGSINVKQVMCPFRSKIRGKIRNECIWS